MGAARLERREQKQIQMTLEDFSVHASRYYTSQHDVSRSRCSRRAQNSLTSPVFTPVPYRIGSIQRPLTSEPRRDDASWTDSAVSTDEKPRQSGLTRRGAARRR